MITGNCLVTTTRPVQDIVAETPEGKIAMFVVISAMDEHLLGESVYIHNGKLYDFIADEQVKGVQGPDLRFMRYIDR